MSGEKEEQEKLRESLQFIMGEEPISVESLSAWLPGVQSADLAVLMKDYDAEKQFKIFQFLPDDEERRELFRFADELLLDTLLNRLDHVELGQYLDEMPPDEAVDILEGRDDSFVETVLGELDESSSADIRSLLRYSEGTAGALMTTNFLKLKSYSKVRDLIAILKDEDADLESMEEGFVVTHSGKILGMFHLREIIALPETHFLLQHIEEDLVSVRVSDSKEDVLKVMSRHSLKVLPVTDHGGVLQGIITADDMLEVAREVSDQDFYYMIGTTGDPTGRNVLSRFFHRVPWLTITLLGGCVSAAILRLFHIDLLAYPVLVVFMPFVVGMAGNVGLQSSTIIVREITGFDSSALHLRRDIVKEMMTGLFNAVFFGGITYLLVELFSFFQVVPFAALAPAVALGLFAAIAFAALTGALTPILFQKLGVDPAISSGPVITMLNDIVGLGLYLTISVAVLRILGVNSLSF